MSEVSDKGADRGAFVVVGAGPGLGAAAARRFGRDGHPVGLIARSAGSLDQIAAGLRAEGITAAARAADVTDAAALTAALGALRETLGPVEVLLFSPRPALEWIRPVLETAPADLEDALSLSVVAASVAVHAVVPDMRRRGRGTLLFTTGGAAVEPHRDRAVSGIAYAAESAYTRMLHDTLAGEGIHAAQVTVVGPLGPGARHEPDEVAGAVAPAHRT